MIDISKIFHVADIHIRNLKRHDEYRSVFKRLFKYLKQNADSKSVIFLGGDIVHSKNDMSPELVDMVSSFLTGCADIAPTIVITGNHDANVGIMFESQPSEKPNAKMHNESVALPLCA